ncbi:hypothetical protein PIB30_060379 [Stylosanthes scabra]|uniref:RNase H type-1 domain-containing protein n=1 Tax=Stylosanthes scabra TaxID=79078 RepID=A0ABU6UNJ2_9FABA|nr:hypothetical protein [Stylosanthes scabra]
MEGSSRLQTQWVLDISSSCRSVNHERSFNYSTEPDGIRENCSNLVQAIKSNSTISEIDAILEDIWFINSNLPESGLVWVPRECNRLAHESAKRLAADVLDPSWSINPPFSLMPIIQEEAPSGYHGRSILEIVVLVVLVGGECSELSLGWGLLGMGVGSWVGRVSPLG